ncbi:hypothetical protein [Actinoplanes sp. NPDC020271]|uniref:hypothetical protein n=1 Tax=Actinoplanes sp. NPDC020271 TaxID=3363896 RepID=UPI0037BD974E
MVKVKIRPADHDAFVEAAAALGVSVDRWLVAAGRRQALADAAVRGRPGARIVTVPVAAATAALLDEHADRAGTTDWAYAARLLHDVVAAPAVDPAQLWTEVLASIGEVVASAQQRAYLERMWIDTIVGSTVLLVAGDAYARDVVELRLRATIAEELSRRLGRRVQVAVTVEEAPMPARRVHQERDRERRETLERALRKVRDLLDGLEPARG